MKQLTPKRNCMPLLLAITISFFSITSIAQTNYGIDPYKNTQKDIVPLREAIKKITQKTQFVGQDKPIHSINCDDYSFSASAADYDPKTQDGIKYFRYDGILTLFLKFDKGGNTAGVSYKIFDSTGNLMEQYQHDFNNISRKKYSYKGSDTVMLITHDEECAANEYPQYFFSKTSFSYDEKGNIDNITTKKLDSFRNADGLAYTNDTCICTKISPSSYDKKGNIIEDPARGLSYQYDNSNHLRSITDMGSHLYFGRYFSDLIKHLLPDEIILSMEPKIQIENQLNLFGEKWRITLVDFDGHSARFLLEVFDKENHRFNWHGELCLTIANNAVEAISYKCLVENQEYISEDHINFFIDTSVLKIDFLYNNNKDVELYSHSIKTVRDGKEIYNNTWRNNISYEYRNGDIVKLSNYDIETPPQNSDNEYNATAVIKSLAYSELYQYYPDGKLMFKIRDKNYLTLYEYDSLNRLKTSSEMDILCNGFSSKHKEKYGYEDSTIVLYDKNGMQIQYDLSWFEFTYKYLYGQVVINSLNI